LAGLIEPISHCVIALIETSPLKVLVMATDGLTTLMLIALSHCRLEHDIRIIKDF
jgi:hypothetical protein